MQMEWADHLWFLRALAERNPTINGINYYGATTYNSGWGIRQESYARKVW